MSALLISHCMNSSCHHLTLDFLVMSLFRQFWLIHITQSAEDLVHPPYFMLLEDCFSGVWPLWIFCLQTKAE